MPCSKYSGDDFEHATSTSIWLLTLRELLTYFLLIYLLTEGVIQNSQSCCHEEEVDKLNKENAERESTVLLQTDSPEFHSEETEEKEEIAFESCYRRSSVQQEDDAVYDACQRITGQEIERESPADEETKEEHQVPGAEEQEERMNEGEGVDSKNEKEDEEPSAPSQNEDEAGQSHDQEAPEGM